MSIKIRPATLEDVDALLQLYFVVYGTSYPLPLGTKRTVMTRLLKKPGNLWLVAVEGEKIVGSLSFEVDSLHRIARAQGLVVLPEARRGGTGARLLAEGTDRLLNAKEGVYSVYATTRTVSRGPQLIFLRQGFVPLGIFPNAHRLENFETITLMAKFAPGVLERRAPLPEVPAALAPITSIIEGKLGSNQTVKVVPSEKPVAKGGNLEFEIIHAPAFVKRLFNQRMPDPYDRFYPFHEPNLLMASRTEDLEIFAHFASDGYCAIVGLNQPFSDLYGRLGLLLQELRSFGVRYIEILIGVNRTESLHSLLASQFLPSAYYPAMFEENGRWHDMVLMSRTMEPLDFRGIEFENSFKPYVDQYVELWKKMHLEVLEIFHDE